MSRVMSKSARGRSHTDQTAETPGEPVDTVVGDEIAKDKPVDDEIVAAATEDETTAGETELDDDVPASSGRAGAWRRIPWSRLIAYGLLPAVALLLASAAGYLKWQDTLTRDAQAARTTSVQAATDGTIALLSYRADTVEKDLQSARSRLTGAFLNAYTSLTHEVVIPGAKQKQISAVATVPAAASISASANHAVALLFVNQSLIIGQDAPTSTASSVRVTLDKVGDHWLISGFDPV
jgi:Mce-associated membrane protein